MRVLAILLAGLLAACTMPLPEDLPARLSPSPGQPQPGEPGSEPGQNQVVPLDQVFSRTALYNQQRIRYLDLNTCAPGTPACINRLNTPLSTLIRYEFYFSDGSPVIGQSPVFNSPRPGEADSPFRQVVRVIVPDGYLPNTIRSSQDVAASQFRTEASNRVLNNPVSASAATAVLPLTLGRAWLQNREIVYLDLGSVPYSLELNRLGLAFVYFLRNNDKTDLPSQPAPIFDTVPGELLYSPIRKVFRAVAENQANELNQDPSRGIRSQEDLLRAVNQGVFRLEDAGEFFNYPVYQVPSLSPENTFELSLAAVRDLPPLPPGAYYALWVTNQLNEARLLLRFRGEGSALQSLDGQLLKTGSQSPVVFSFSPAEVETFRHFLVTIEQGEVSQPTGSTLLEAQYAAREETELSVPFAASYRSLQPGGFLLAAPTAPDGGRNGSGIWFVQRTDTGLRSLPLNRELDPGLIMSLPPRGWTYNGWVLTDLRSGVWLQTGRFRAVNQPDQRKAYHGPGDAYTFPGEDFLAQAPAGVPFPLMLASTGELELVVSLEPEGLSLQRPYFMLYRTILAKGTPELINQPLPVHPMAFPVLRLRLEP